MINKSVPTILAIIVVVAFCYWQKLEVITPAAAGLFVVCIVVFNVIGWLLKRKPGPNGPTEGTKR
jgi:MFS superfamily sulfate permease-like transporter